MEADGCLFIFLVDRYPLASHLFLENHLHCLIGMKDGKFPIAVCVQVVVIEGVFKRLNCDSEKWRDCHPFTHARLFHKAWFDLVLPVTLYPNQLHAMPLATRGDHGP